MPLDFKNTKTSTPRKLPASARTENSHTEQVGPQRLEGKEPREPPAHPGSAVPREVKLVRGEI